MNRFVIFQMQLSLFEIEFFNALGWFVFYFYLMFFETQEPSRRFTAKVSAFVLWLRISKKYIME